MSRDFMRILRFRRMRREAAPILHSVARKFEPRSSDSERSGGLVDFSRFHEHFTDLGHEDHYSVSVDRGEKLTREYLKGSSQATVKISAFLANAIIRQAANKSSIALSSGGFPNLANIIKEDPASLVRGFGMRIFYNFTAIPITKYVAKLMSQNKKPHELSDLEKITIILVGSGVEFSIGSLLDMASIQDNLEAVKARQSIIDNPKILNRLSDQAFRDLVEVKNVEEFRLDKMSTKDLEALISNDQTKLSRHVGEIVKLNPKTKLNPSDISRAVISSSLFHTIRNSSFLFSLYYSVNRKGDMTAKDLTKPFGAGVVTYFPHLCGNEAILESVRGKTIFESIVGGVRTAGKTIIENPKAIVIGAMIRGMANVLAAIIFNKNLNEEAEDMVFDCLSELNGNSYSEEEKAAIEKTTKFLPRVDSEEFRGLLSYLVRKEKEYNKEKAKGGSEKEISKVVLAGEELGKLLNSSKDVNSTEELDPPSVKPELRSNVVVEVGSESRGSRY